MNWKLEKKKVDKKKVFKKKSSNQTKNATE